MQSTRFAAVPLLLLLAIQILTNCSSPASNGNAVNSSAAAPNSSSTSKVVPKDNVDEFMILVRLPFEPEEVAWEETAANKSLTAVIRFSPENASKMSAELAKIGEGAPEKLSVETWYTAELIAQGELSGESAIQGRSFAAESFLNPPYTRGKIARIENTDYFILQITG
jgi:hypothetical protein